MRDLARSQQRALALVRVQVAIVQHVGSWWHRKVAFNIATASCCLWQRARVNCLSRKECISSWVTPKSFSVRSSREWRNMSMAWRIRQCQYACHICLMARTDPSSNLADQLFDAVGPCLGTKENICAIPGQSKPWSRNVRDLTPGRLSRRQRTRRRWREQPS